MTEKQEITYTIEWDPSMATITFSNGVKIETSWDESQEYLEEWMESPDDYLWAFQDYILDKVKEINENFYEYLKENTEIIDDIYSEFWEE